MDLLPTNLNPKTQALSIKYQPQNLAHSGEWGGRKIAPSSIEIAGISRESAQEIAEITAAILAVVPVELSVVTLAITEELKSRLDPNDPRILAQRLYNRIKEKANLISWARHNGDCLKPIFDDWKK